ncbi:MAG TPA: CsbD family protein, partial [Lactobacillus sp.]|nr:CsbD family protein [Lactobacillus sp.]
MADFDAAKDKVSGKVKETAGKVTGDESTEAKGKTEQMVG